jgi:hypothetical protein
MPSRIIRESARFSPTLWALSAEAERMFWRLTIVADDWGRFDADPRVLLAQCFPLGVEDLTVRQVQGWFTEMVQVGLLQAYPVNGRTYGKFITWEKYQRTRAGRSKFPEPPSLAESSGNVPESAENSGLGYRGESAAGISAIRRRSRESSGNVPESAGSSGRSQEPTPSPPAELAGSGELSEALQKAIKAMQCKGFHRLARPSYDIEAFWNAILEKVESNHLTIFPCLIDVDLHYAGHPEKWPANMEQAKARMISGIDTAITKLLRQQRKVQHG